MREHKIVFAGTPEFACPALEALLTNGFNLCAVYTQPDRPAGRGRQPQASPVKQLAIAHQIPVYQPERLKGNNEALAELRAIAPTIMVVAAYGLILPPEVLAMPTHGCINIHASLLPRWRGAAPIQRAIQAGDTHSGICIMDMEAGLDTGGVFLQQQVDIEAQDTAATLHDRLAKLGALALVEALPSILKGSLKPVPQSQVGIIYAQKLTKAEAQIDWSLAAEKIDRNVRAFSPWPIAFTHFGETMLRILAGHPIAHPDKSTHVGSVYHADHTGIYVATGNGAYVITRLQPAGKKPMSAQDFINARNLVGAHLA